MKLEFGQRADLADIRRIGIPRALLYYRYGIAWRTFFTELGLEVVLDAPSDRGTLEVGDRLSVDECCLASKLFLGHVAALVDQGVDAVFVPSLMGYGRFDTFLHQVPGSSRSCRECVHRGWATRARGVLPHR